MASAPDDDGLVTVGRLGAVGAAGAGSASERSGKSAVWTAAFGAVEAIGGDAASPFALADAPDKSIAVAAANALIRLSRLRHARPFQIIDQQTGKRCNVRRKDEHGRHRHEFDNRKVVLEDERRHACKGEVLVGDQR